MKLELFEENNIIYITITNTSKDNAVYLVDNKLTNA